MGMVKLVSPSGWDFDQPVASLVKVGSRGLIGNDRADFIKRASHVFLSSVDRLKAAADEVPVHLIALGAHEAYGANRNGDSFKEATCRDCHDTFVKYAHWFRSHKNKDPLQSYGIVKASAYNEPMRRVELLVFLNKEKSAADRNRGLVADKELQKLASGSDLGVSMACRVPHDVCNYCGHQARTRDEYCKEASCAAGGCAENLTKLVKVGGDVHHLGVYNPNPTWFDISLVFRPADRTAYGNRADWLEKAAADGFFGVGGAKMAEDMGVTAPLAIIVEQASWGRSLLDGPSDAAKLGQLKLAYGLHLLDENPLDQVRGEVYRAFSNRAEPDLTFLGLPGSKEACEGLAALADEKIVLPLASFASWTKAAEHADAAARVLPGVYGRMLADNTLERRLGEFVMPPKLAALRQRRAAFRLKEAMSLDGDAVQARCQLSAIRREPQPTAKVGFGVYKQAADRREVEELARSYALYQLAALHKIASFDPEFALTAKLAAAQNHV